MKPVADRRGGANRWNATRLAVVFAGLALVSFAPAAETNGASQTFAERAEASLLAYKDQSAKIADEKIPMLREISALEDENLRLRQAVELAQHSTNDNNTSFDALKNRLEILKSQTDYANRHLREYLDGFESRIHVAEDQRYKEGLTKIRLALDEPTIDQRRRFEQELASLDLGLKRAESIVGGYQFEGHGITVGGVMKTGTIHVIGPSAIFSDLKGGGSDSGLLNLHPGTIEPGIVPLHPSYSQIVSAFIQNKTGPVPLDASLGNAAVLERANGKVAEHVRNGGPVGYAIILLGVVAVVLTVVKILDLRRFHSVTTDQLQEIIRQARARNEPAALALARNISGPVGEMLEVGVRNLGGNPLLLEDMMLGVMLRRRPELERFLSFLAVTAVASPLMGLLGTVAGMIHTFSLMTIFGAGDPRALSSGISEALITTEFGLLVAIPAVAVHGVLARMIKSRLGDMERVAFEFVKTLSLEETATPPAAR